MAKFYGSIGYEYQVETPPDSSIWKVQKIEKSYCGDILQNTRRLDSGEKINDDVTISNRFSILCDSFAIEHTYAMRYLIWNGVKWKINSIETQYPRLIINVGGVYNG